MSFIEFIKLQFKEKPLQGNFIYGKGQAIETADKYDAIAKEGFQDNPLVYAIISKLSDISGGLPYVFERYDSKGETIELIENGELYDLWNNPNDMQGAFQFRKDMAAYFYLAGVAFIKKGRKSDSSKTNMLWNIQPDAIEPISMNSYGEIANYRMKLNSENIRKEDVIFLKSFNPLKPESGFSMVKASGLLIDTYNAMMRWNLSLAQNGGIPPMVVKPKGAKFTTEQRSQIEDNLKRKVMGWNNAGKPLIQDGEADYQILGIKPAEAQWLESMQELWRQICVSLGVSPEIFGSEKGTTFNNRAEAMKDLYMNVILPKANILTDAINTQLIPEFYGRPNSRGGVRLSIDKSQIDALNESQDALYNRMDKAFNSGLVSVGEARQEMGYATDAPHSDLFYMNANKTPIA